MKKIHVSELDVVMLTYDEPNAEANWSDLLNKVPWAQRVHGVRGFDAAHKAAADLAQTERFITVDGDNIVMPDFFDQTLEIPDTDRNGNNTDQVIFSWNAKNLLNGLVYGNGGLKCWPTEYTKTIQTHEASVEGDAMEFCWKLNYMQLNDMFSEVHQTASAFQAFRSGFREGVKMSLDRGSRVLPAEFSDTIWQGNFNRLQVWCNIGSDVKNGLWAIYGARMGCHRTLFNIGWDPNDIADYEWFRDFFSDVESGVADDNQLWKKICELGEVLNSGVPGMTLFDPEPTMSKFFKSVYVNPRRFGAMITERDILDLINKGHNVY